MASEQPEHTLRFAVIGASLAGPFAAAAVSRAGHEAVHEAVLIERDRLGDTAAPRAGVPQGEQPHVFLLRGLLAAEELLPGLRPIWNRAGRCRSTARGWRGGVSTDG